MELRELFCFIPGKGLDLISVEFFLLFLVFFFIYIWLKRDRVQLILLL